MSIKYSPKDYPDKRYYEPSKNYDYLTTKDDGKTFVRAGHVYNRPFGYYRYAIKVTGKYSNDTWLGDDGVRANSTDGEWPISYHGTTRENADNIVKYGFDDSKCKPSGAYGVGHYSSPYTEVAEGYAPVFEWGGSKYKILIQNRCNPAGTRFDCNNGKIWVTKHSQDIRPYNLCVKQV